MFRDAALEAANPMPTRQPCAERDHTFIVVALLDQTYLVCQKCQLRRRAPESEPALRANDPQDLSS